jgi:alkane 1-monooxygenase
MKNKDLKYLLAYLVPVSVILSIYWGGWYSWITFLFVFGLLPVLEHVFPPDTSNHREAEENERKKIQFFDVLLYLNVPLIYGVLGLYILWRPETTGVWYEWAGSILALGIMLGANGINVAHELGHRNTAFEKTLSKLLLLPSHYMHFIIEHNYGHHKHVATPKDPATAMKNESVYHFWWRSTLYSWLSAWKIERKRLNRKQQSFWSMHNEMVRFTVFQLAWNAGIFFIFGLHIWITFFLAGVVGFLLLESINYIEHYGILRNQISKGKYEPVMPHHSWNADFVMGRIMLYELTRHSDHHYKADRKYQILRHVKTAPQLPWGYPASILMALVPPIWFSKVNPLLTK